MSQLDDKLNTVISLKRKIKPGKGEGQKTLHTPYSCTRYTAITQKYKLGISSNIFMYISLCPPEWYQMANFGSLAHRLLSQFPRKVPKWKVRGPEMVHRCWLKNFTGLHHSIAPAWQMPRLWECFWMDDQGKNHPYLERPRKSCSNHGKLPDKLCKFLDSKNVPPDKQKGCRRGSQGTKDQLYINKLILREGKMRKKNLVMGCIDYKACFMILHTWILECLELFGAAWQLTKSSLKDWQTDLGNWGAQVLQSAWCWQHASWPNERRNCERLPATPYKSCPLKS